MNSVLLHAGDTMEPDEFKVPKPLDDWFDPAPNTAKGGATFDKVDNPGVWGSFSYRPVFASGSQGVQYKFHFLLDGCQPVSPNEYYVAINTHVEWNFFYQGWKKGGDKYGLRENTAEEDPPRWVDVQ